jgi:hypothetical protein
VKRLELLNLKWGAATGFSSRPYRIKNAVFALATESKMPLKLNESIHVLGR